MALWTDIILCSTVFTCHLQINNLSLNIKNERKTKSNEMKEIDSLIVDWKRLLCFDLFPLDREQLEEARLSNHPWLWLSHTSQSSFIIVIIIIIIIHNNCSSSSSLIAIVTHVPHYCDTSIGGIYSRGHIPGTKMNSPRFFSSIPSTPNVSVWRID